MQVEQNEKVKVQTSSHNNRSIQQYFDPTQKNVCFTNTSYHSYFYILNAYHGNLKNSIE